MATQTLEQYKEVLDRNFDEYTRALYADAPSESQNIVQEIQVDRPFYKMGGVQGIHGPVANRDFENIPFYAPVKSYTTFANAVPYRAGWIVERSLIENGQSHVVIDNLQDMMRSEKTLRDVTAVNLLNNGLTAQGYEPTEADGTRRALFSTGHVREDGATTISNYYQAAVPPNLSTIYDAGLSYLARLQDQVGNFVADYMDFTIVTPTVASNFVKAADVIVKSQEDPETANRAMNTATSRFQLKHVSLNQLTSTSYWFLRIDVGSRVYPLVMANRSSPEVTPLEKMANNPDAMFSRMRSVFGPGIRKTFRGIVIVGP